MTLLSDIVEPPNPVTINLSSTYNGRLVIDEPSATSITVTGLQTLNGVFEFTSRSAPKCKSILFSDLVSIGTAALSYQGGLRIHDHALLQSFSAPLLAELRGYTKSFFFGSLPKLTTLNLPALTEIEWNKNHNVTLTIRDTALVSLSLALVRIIRLAGLVPTIGKILISNNPNLTTLNLNSLRDTFKLYVGNNPQLSSIGLASIPIDDVPIKTYFNANALPTSMVNALILQMEGSSSQWTWTTVPLFSVVGGSNGAPTGAALTVADNNGWPHN